MGGNLDHEWRKNKELTNEAREFENLIGYSRRKIGFSIDNLWELKKKKYFPGRRRIMSHSTQCKHRPLHEIESKLYPDYEDGLFQRMYIELKEEVRQSEIKKGKDLTVV